MSFDEAYQKACELLGPRAQLWCRLGINEQAYRVGTAGVGCAHTIWGYGNSWDAAFADARMRITAYEANCCFLETRCMGVAAE